MVTWSTLWHAIGGVPRIIDDEDVFRAVWRARWSLEPLESLNELIQDCEGLARKLADAVLDEIEKEVYSNAK